MSTDQAPLLPDKNGANNGSQINARDRGTFATGYMNLVNDDDAAPMLDEFSLNMMSERCFSHLMSHMPDPSIKPLEWNPEVTFNLMVYRQLLRRLQGTYKKDQNWEKWGRRVIYFVIIATIAGSISTAKSKSSEILAVGLGTLVLSWLLLTTLSYIMIWFYLAWLVLSIATRDPLAFFKSDLSDRHEEMKQIVLYCAVAVNIITIFFHVARTTWYPSAVRSGTLGPKYYGLRAIGQVCRNEMAYLSWPRRKLRYLPYILQEMLFIDDDLRWRRVAYTGGLDEARRPHGAGRWKEEGEHGETLTGWWHHGVPSAPFKSLECHTGYSFHSTRIALVSNRQEKENIDQMFFVPKHRSVGVVYSIASVECSVSGKFFRHLPQIGAISSPPKGAPGALWAIASLVSPIDSIIKKKHYPPDGIAYCKGDVGRNYLKEAIIESKYGEAEHGSIHVDDADYSVWLRRALREATAINVSNMNSRRGNTTEPSAHVMAEALIFIHGFSTSAAVGLYALAQLLTLGDFPPHILPFVFTWPAGQLVTYPLARDRGATSERTQHDFIYFLKELGESGITKVNIMTHSMGVRVLMSACKLFETVFQPLDDSDSFVDSGNNMLRLETVTMLNPDYEESDFISVGGTYDFLRCFCPVITVYADSNDEALLAGSALNWSASLGRATKGLRRFSTPNGNKSKLVEESGLPFKLSLSGQQRLSEVGAISIHNVQSEVDQLKYVNMKLMETCTGPHGGIDTDSGTVRGVIGPLGFGPEFGDRNNRPFAEDDKKEYVLLDVDLIDTTWLENNIHSVRHSFFNINPTIVDDLRELIVFHSRAEDRTQTTHKFDNVYCYMVAPNVVKNK